MIEASANEFVVHQAPVWRDRSNFVINAILLESDAPKRYEQLFSRQVENDRFEICCIPFFLYDVSLGDVVRTAPRDDHKYVMVDVAQPSGRFVFRVWFGESSETGHEVEQDLILLGSLTEWSSQNLLAIDAADKYHAQRVADYLAKKERSGQLIYETGRK